MYVGICIEPTLASIGVYNTSTRFNQFQFGAQCPTEIAITEAGILVGPEAARYSGRSNFFNVVTLLKTSGNNKEDFSKVISAYLSHLLRKFEEKHKPSATGAVFALTFHNGSATRERLLQAAELSGLTRVLIVPAPVAIAVGSVIEDSCSGDVSVLRRHRAVFVCHYSKLSFGMSLVRIRDGEVEITKTLAMENLPEGSNGNFVLAHAHLFSNAVVADNSQYWVYQAYQKSVRQVLEGCKVTDIESFVVATTSKTSFKIENMLRDALKRPVLRNVDSVQGPLKGVAWMSSSLMGKGAEEEHEAARFSNWQSFCLAAPPLGFKLVMNGQTFFKTSEEVQTCIKNCNVNGKFPQSFVVFKFPFNVKGKGKIAIKLEEQTVSNEQVFLDVEEYNLVFECPVIDNNTSYGLRLECVCSQNGVFSLTVAEKPVEVKVELKKTVE